MVRFAIITPTIGRDTLKRCLLMMRHQVMKEHYDYVQFVVGDGPQDPQVAEWCKQESRVIYLETPTKEGFYGTNPRNVALNAIEEGRFGQFDYVLFLDDDNLLLEAALYNLVSAICVFDRPPLLWHDILFTNKYRTEYSILPVNGKPVAQGDWDSLNGVYRTDVIRGLRWQAVYEHDFLFAKEAQARVQVPWVKCLGVGAVHCLSWDTYEPKGSTS